VGQSNTPHPYTVVATSEQHQPHCAAQLAQAICQVQQQQQQNPLRRHALRRRRATWPCAWAAHLSHPLFRELPRQAEEYGFPPGGAGAGPVALPCDEGLFGHVLRHLSSSSTPSRFVTLGDIKSGAVLSGCCASSAGEALPLLLHQGVAADEAVW
jgi:hypothetical protein